MKNIKVLIDGVEDEFIDIFKPNGGRGLACNYWQCNTSGHRSAHTFSMHPKFLKGQTVKASGHTYKFP